VSYLAQVQIACFSGIPSDPETAKRSVSVFAEASMNIIRKVFAPLGNTAE
jgi:hypothetical protein